MKKVDSESYETKHTDGFDHFRADYEGVGDWSEEIREQEAEFEREKCIAVLEQIMENYQQEEDLVDEMHDEIEYEWESLLRKYHIPKKHRVKWALRDRLQYDLNRYPHSDAERTGQNYVIFNDEYKWENSIAAGVLSIFMGIYIVLAAANSTMLNILFRILGAIWGLSVVYGGIVVLRNRSIRKKIHGPFLTEWKNLERTESSRQTMLYENISHSNGELYDSIHVPDKYRTREAVGFFHNYFQERKANTISEAVQLYRMRW